MKAEIFECPACGHALFEFYFAPDMILKVLAEIEVVSDPPAVIACPNCETHHRFDDLIRMMRVQAEN